MKKILTMCAAILVVGGGYAAWRFAQPEHYGHPFKHAPQASIAQLAQDGVAGGQHDARVEGRIVRQCPATGCWFYIDDGAGSQLKVELGGVVPQLPQRIGRRAIVEGRMVRVGGEPVFVGSGVEFRK